MAIAKNNYAFIDSQNLNLGVKDLGWTLDFKKFRRYLADKYDVGAGHALLFIGYKPGNEHLYAYLQRIGYICIFKPALVLPNGVVKGNVDAELVLHTMIEFPNFDSAIIVSGDGDFRCLADYLLEKEKLDVIMAPNSKKLSTLLHSLAVPGRRTVVTLDNMRHKLSKE